MHDNLTLGPQSCLCKACLRSKFLRLAISKVNAQIYIIQEIICHTFKETYASTKYYESTSQLFPP